MFNRLLEGRKSEEKACAYLASKGLCLIEKNYRSKTGEIDLIMKDDNCYVFVEVRSKKSQRFGGALLSVNYPKQQKIIKTAVFYLVKKKLYQRCPMRFDVVAFEGPQSELKWVKNAFSDSLFV